MICWTQPEGCGYMQPRTMFWPPGYRMGPIPGGIVCPSTRNCDECDVDNVQETTFTESKHHEDESENMMKKFRSNDNALNNRPIQVEKKFPALFSTVLKKSIDK